MEGLTQIFIPADGNKYFLTNTLEQCEEVLNELHTVLFPNVSYASNDEKAAMQYFLYKTFYLYKHAPLRTINKDAYVNHAIRVAKITGLVSDDIVTKIAALGHDGPEEFYEAKLRKRVAELAETDLKKAENLELKLESNINMAKTYGEYNKIQKKIKKIKQRVESEFVRQEEKILTDYLQEMEGHLLDELEKRVDKEYAKDLVKRALTVMALVTRKQDELYYDSVKKVFTAEEAYGRPVNKEDRERAVTVKFADCFGNTIELEKNGSSFRQTKNKKRKGEELYEKVTVKEIVELYVTQEKDTPEFAREKKKLETRVKQYSRHRPRYGNGSFKPYQKLYRCYKDLILINEYRIYKNTVNEIPEVTKIKLLDETMSVLDDILTNLCNYHIGSSKGAHLTFDKVYAFYQEMEIYKQKDGLHKVTEPILENGRLNSYDGILKFFFDARVRGDDERLREAYKNKADLFRITYGLKALVDEFRNDSMFVLSGFDKMNEKSI